MSDNQSHRHICPLLWRRSSRLLRVVSALGSVCLLGPVSASATPASTKAGTEMEGQILTTPYPRQIVSVSPRNGTERVLFKAGDGLIIGPAATPDGRRIAFVLQRSPRRLEGAPRVRILRDEVWVMRGDGTGAHPIRAFVRKRRGAKRIYSPLPQPFANLESIDISKDGSQLLFLRDGEILTMDAAGGPLQEVQFSGGVVTPYTGKDETGPQFAPGGRIIAHFVVTNEELNRNEERIGTVPVEGGTIKLIPTRFHAWAPTYSDDGRSIAFVAEGPPPTACPRCEGPATIWVMRSDGRKVRQLASHPDLGFHNPDFAPNGKWVVFHANRYEIQHIGKETSATYVVSSEGGPLKRIAGAVASFYGGNPEWVR
jgi:Tol biopolymer transport system component